MTKILLLSDTHNFLDQKIFKYADAVDEIWHAGDIGTITVCDELKKIKPLRAVFGNIDGNDVRVEYPEDLIFDCEGVKVLITHIGGYPDRYNQRAKKLIEEHRPKLFICGHSHILKVMYDKKYDLLHMNPGACGIHGFHLVKTLLEFTISNDKISDLKVIELGPRVG